uniref:Uncharacterized protein n=1 Tax=Ditylenchus dipsaci TaxID=166011 RepID=A0A915DWB4_9BILA
MELVHRLAIFFSLILFTLAFALALTSLLTDFWIETDGLEHNGVISKAIFVHSGLFHGVRQIDWVFGPKFKIFSVFQEIQTHISFMNKTSWIIMLFFIALGLLWTFVGLLISLLNTVIEEIKNVTGPTGIYLWSSLSVTSHGIALALFLHQYYGVIQENVLLEEHLTARFSSAGHVGLGFSFWLLAFGCAIQVLPIVLIFLSQTSSYRKQMHERKAGKRNLSSGAESTDADSTLFMY